MADQMQFMKKMDELIKTGQAGGNRLSGEEIRTRFSDLNLDDKQLYHIEKYLQSHGIQIENWDPDALDPVLDEDLETPEDPLDQSLVNTYLKETAGSSKLTPDQERTITRKLVSGDKNARSLLIEANLAYAVEIAREFEKKGVQLSDLIQESNIGLMMAVNDYEPELHGNFHEFAGKRIREYLTETIDSYNQSTRSAVKMANRINELNDIATAFAREYEREAKPSELARRMGISEDEVRELMKVSLDAIAVLKRD